MGEGGLKTQKFKGKYMYEVKLEFQMCVGRGLGWSNQNTSHKEGMEIDFNPNISGYVFEYVSGEFSFLTVEWFNACDKTVYIVGDFIIDLLKSESCNYAHNFLLSLQSYSFIPLIDKPTRVYGNSATLIDNILVNNTTNLLSCGNIILDISDHFLQFCVMSNNLMKRSVNGFKKVRDFLHFSEVKFLAEVSNINWNKIISLPNMNNDKLFSKLYNKLNKVVNTHVPFKIVSKRRARQLSEPWITKGIRKSINIKNSLYHSNVKDQYRLDRNKISTLIRLSKKQYFYNYFQWNIFSMKKTWAGISELINRRRKKMKKIPALKDESSGRLIYDQKELPSILNKHFASCGAALAAKLPHPEHHFSEFLVNNPKTFYLVK